MGIMAFMLTSKKVLAHVGLLDCDYPLYAEDMDWCYRAKRLGYSIIYNPSLVLTHTGGLLELAGVITKHNLRNIMQKKFS